MAGAGAIQPLKPPASWVSRWIIFGAVTNPKSNKKNAQPRMNFPIGWFFLLDGRPRMNFPNKKSPGPDEFSYWMESHFKMGFPISKWNFPFIRSDLFDLFSISRGFPISPFKGCVEEVILLVSREHHSESYSILCSCPFPVKDHCTWNFKTIHGI